MRTRRDHVAQVDVDQAARQLGDLPCSIKPQRGETAGVERGAQNVFAVSPELVQQLARGFLRVVFDTKLQRMLFQGGDDKGALRLQQSRVTAQAGGPQRHRQAAGSFKL